MTAREQERIICLQKQVKLARDTLTKIASSYRRTDGLASETLDEMDRLEWASKPTPLQGLVGHE